MTIKKKIKIRFEKSSSITFGSMILIIAISLAGLYGCSFRELPKEDMANKEVTAEKDANDGSSLAGYISLLGLSKDKLADTLNEKPISVDEGGLEFVKAGIRVWFDPENGTSVSQIFTVRKDIDLNGVRIGDKIEMFKETFGEPVSDRNGDMHFKYKDVFLSVNYDTSTRDTYALYILKKDF